MKELLGLGEPAEVFGGEPGTGTQGTGGIFSTPTHTLQPFKQTNQPANQQSSKLKFYRCVSIST